MVRYNSYYTYFAAVPPPISPIFILTLISTLLFIHIGDPHPGNILLCRDPKDGTPHLGLIDYGQVKRLTKEQRHLFCRLLIALDDENREEVVRLMKIAGKWVYATSRMSVLH
jgi:predicted unusual protein kinase regulating ubiquinone biosynthesis (AarF/ABC1/UbiB family)